MNRMEIEAAIQELYIGILGRAGEPAGVKYWADEIEAGTMVLENTRAAFTQQLEYTSIYEGLTSEELVIRVYQNLLEREPDSAGLAYWAGELESGGPITPDMFVLAVINAAKEGGNSDAQVLQNKLSAATHFAGLAASKATNQELFDAARAAVADVTADTATLTQSINNMAATLESIADIPSDENETPATATNYELPFITGEPGVYRELTVNLPDGDIHVLADRDVSNGDFWQYDITNFGAGDTLRLGTNILADFDGELPLDGQPGTAVSSLILDAMNRAAEASTNTALLVNETDRAVLAEQFALFFEQRANQLDIQAFSDSTSGGSKLAIDAHYATDAWPATLAEVTQQYRINISFEVNDLSISEDIRTTLGFDLQGYELLRNPVDHGGLIEQTSGETSEAINLLGFVAVHGLIDFFS